MSETLHSEPDTRECLIVERDGATLLLTLDRPKQLNALSDRLMAEVSAALEEARRDDDVRVVVFRGSGRCFSAGYEIASDDGWWPDQTPAQVMWDLEDRYLAWARSIWAFPKPTIASVHGYCLAGACELAMLCDITVASEDAIFGEPEIRFSSGPPALIMPFVIGLKAAKELLLTGSHIPAARALELGMVNAVVPRDELARRTEYYARLIAQVSPVAVRIQKDAINRAIELGGLDAALRLNAKSVGVLDATPTPEIERFDAIRKERGLRAAMDWRDSQFAEIEALLRPEGDGQAADGQ